jgi:hypothetical protein
MTRGEELSESETTSGYVSRSFENITTPPIFENPLKNNE